TSRLDIPLIRDVAKNLKKGSLVLIGPQDEAFVKSELHNIPNIHFIAKKKTELVPAYLSYFDVCINPQVVNEITLGNFPLKIVEYLAVGKPIVAIATNTMKEVFSEHTYLAASSSEFSQQIENALAEDNESLKRERVEYSKNFSWKKVAESFLKVVNALDEKQKSVI